MPREEGARPGAEQTKKWDPKSAGRCWLPALPRGCPILVLKSCCWFLGVSQLQETLKSVLVGKKDAGTGSGWKEMGLSDVSRRRFPAGSCPNLFKTWKGARASGRTQTCPLRPLLLPLPCCDSRDVLFWLPQFFHEETGDSGMCCEAGQALVVQLLYHGHSPWLLVPLEPRGF